MMDDDDGLPDDDCQIAGLRLLAPRLDCLWIASMPVDYWITLTCGLPEDLDLDCRPFFT